jgi:opacity protein-like surface antigen
MKKVLIVFLLCFGMSTVNAQMVKFGIKGGANFSNLEGDGIKGSNYTSFHFGALVEAKVFENFAIQPELLYSSQGTKVDAEGLKDINYSYITVPVLAKFYLTEDGLSLEAGPQFSFLIDENVKDQFEGEKFDFGVVGGLSYNITKNFFASARYVVGLTDASRDAEVTNRVIQLSVGYKF